MNETDVCLINNNLPDFSFMSFIATPHLGLLDCHITAQENAGTNWNVAYNTSISLTMKRQESQSFTVTYVSSIPLCTSYSYADNDDKGNANISLVVWVALGKHQIAQQLVGHPVKKQISVAENSFDCFMMCTVYKNAFQKRLQACIRSFIHSFGLNNRPLQFRT